MTQLRDTLPALRQFHFYFMWLSLRVMQKVG